VPNGRSCTCVCSAAGYITTKELGTVLRALGKSPTEAEIKLIVKEVDPDGRGVVDYKEFDKILTRDIRQYDSEQDLKAAWKVRAALSSLASQLRCTAKPRKCADCAAS
jgi:hypothetical protein